MLLTRNMHGEYYMYMYQQHQNENRTVLEVQSNWLKAFWSFQIKMARKCQQQNSQIS